MAIVALVPGGRVICGFARCLHAVVAAKTGRRGLEMIEPRYAEVPEIVALVAVQRGGYMVTWPTGGQHVVMATYASAYYLGVVHGIDRYPLSREYCMTGITHITAINV